MAEHVGRHEVVRPRIIDETIDGEVVAINLDSGVYYSLRDVAAAIWAGVCARASVSEIAAALEARVGPFEGGEDAVAHFVTELVQAGLARPSAETGADEWTVDGLGDQFATPVLETFNDLEDLLLLDPIHDVDAEGWPRITAQTE